MKEPTRGSGESRLERFALGTLLAVTLVAVAGYWIFALHPERLVRVPRATEIYAVAFPLFARLHVIVSALALGVILARRAGVRWLPALVAVAALSFLSEHAGTGYGFPFGEYRYTALLGPTLGGRVPLLIPLSWFLMALPSWLLARRAVGGEGSALIRVGLGALWLTVWDLALDPAMSHLTAYWVWAQSGPYYGMPWVNLFGWYTTGLLLMGALEWTGRWFEADRLEGRWIPVYYGTVVLMPLGMLVAAGRWGAVAATLAGVAAVWSLGRLLGSRGGPGREAPGSRVVRGTPSSVEAGLR